MRLTSTPAHPVAHPSVACRSSQHPARASAAWPRRGRRSSNAWRPAGVVRSHPSGAEEEEEETFPDLVTRFVRSTFGRQLPS